MASSGSPSCDCPVAFGVASLNRSMHCFLRQVELQACTTSATSRASILGLKCMNVSDTRARGFFVLSRSLNGALVCSGGDTYHLRVQEQQQVPQQRLGRERQFERQSNLYFSALSQPMGLGGLYWLNTSATFLPGVHAYALSLSLVETNKSICVWQRIASHVVHVSSPPLDPSADRACVGVPEASSLAYVRLGAGGSCHATGASSGMSLCIGNATARVIDTSNERRLHGRLRVGFEHVLRSSSCRFQLYDEHALTRCLRGRTLLLMGSAFNVDVQRGFALLNRSLAAWTRVPPGKKHPNIADFWRAFEKPSGSYCFARGKCSISFGKGRVRSSLFHYPAWGGLANLLGSQADATGASPSSAPGSGAYYRRMCQNADIVVIESGYEDVAFPATATRGAVGVAERSSEDHRWQHTLGQYRSRLYRLMRDWRRCRAERGSSWRPIFQLTAASRARGLHGEPRAADCKQQPGGHGGRPGADTGRVPLGEFIHRQAAINELARRVVEEAGFEVFDPFGASLHAPSFWFDKLKGPLEYDSRKAEVISDMTAQMLANQLCAH
jgi:hypothetical protein